MNLRCELIVEKDGKEVYRGESKSFVQNFAKAMMVIHSSPGNTSLDTGGAITSVLVTCPDNVNRSIYGEWYSGSTYGGGVHIAMSASNDDDSFGIWVGTGTASVSPTDYNLASKISHGTGVGQLDYEPHTVTSSYSDTYSYVEISRVFVNKSGSDIIVREVGLVARNYWKDTTAVRNDVKFLIARDVLPTPVTVRHLGSLTVRYRISLSTT